MCPTAVVSGGGVATPTMDTPNEGAALGTATTVHTVTVSTLA